MKKYSDPETFAAIFVVVLLVLLALAGHCQAQNYVSLTGSQVGGSTPVTGTILLQATGTNGAAISYQVGGGGQQITYPTSCVVTGGAIVQPCLVANVLLTSPQNFCFQTSVKNSAGRIVIGGPHSGYECLKPVPNSNPANWCVAGSCSFDLFVPGQPGTILVINMPLPQTLTLGGIYSGDCNPGTVAIGYGADGHPHCGPGGTGGGGTWGGITGLLTNQLDLAAALSLLSPITSPGFLGVPTSVTAPANDNSTQIATDAFVKAQGYAALNSPAFTGLPTAPTVSLGDSSNSLATTAWVAGQNFGVGTGNMTGPGTTVVSDVVLWNSVNGTITKTAGFGFPLAPSHLGTLVSGQNGLAASATSDTTNATNILSGTLNAARLPLPTPTTVGGVKALTAVSHNWVNSITTAGAAVASQPACADISDAVPSCRVDATNATNIASGTLAISRLGTLLAGQNGLAASATSDTTNAANILTGTLVGARMAAVNLAATGNGGVTGSLPATSVGSGYPATNISGTLPAAQVGTGYPAASITGTLPAAQVGTGYLFSSLGGTSLVALVNPYATLTFGATTTWAVASAPVASATVTLTGNTTLNLTGLLSGGSYVLRVVQDATGGRTLTLGTGCTWKVSNGGGGAVTTTAAASAVDFLAFVYNGTSCYANFVKNFT